MSQHRCVTQTGVKLDELGAVVELNVAGMTDLVGQVDITDGVFGAARLAYEFSAAAAGGKFVEIDTANRIAAEGVTGFTPIVCSGYQRVRLRVVVVSATSGTIATVSLSSRGN